MNRKILTVAIMLIMVFSIPIVGKAHEFSPNPVYYGDLSTYSTSNPVANVNYNYNINQLTSNTTYRTLASDAISNWKSAAPRFNAVSTSYSSSKVDFSDSWPVSFNSSWYGVFDWTLDWTPIYQYTTTWYGPPSSTYVWKVSYGKIIVNSTKMVSDSFSNDDIRKTYAHEIGHSLGFDETNDGTQSVMRQGKGSTFGWSDYWKPSSHDTSDFNSKYRYRLWS